MNGFHMLTKGDHSKIPFTPFDKLRANGILEWSTAIFRFIAWFIFKNFCAFCVAYRPYI